MHPAKTRSGRLAGHLLPCLVVAAVLAAGAWACESTEDYYPIYDVLPDPAPDAAPDTALPDPQPDPDAPPPDLPYDAPPDPVADLPPDLAPDVPTDPGMDDAAGGTCYSEPLAVDASLADLESAYSGYNYVETMFETLNRRWPAGHDLFVAIQDDPYLGAFTDTSSFSTVMESLMTEVHEGTHGWDYGNASWGTTFAYFLRGDLAFYVTWIDGFPRSEIRGMLADDSTSLYADTYLSGEQGTYGFVELLDELNCYINGMAGIAVVGEYISGYGISGIDGAVAFLYYLELYLKRARTSYPELYARIQGDPQIVELVKTQWLRTHFFLAVADRFPSLGIYDDAIRANLYSPDNMSEISLFIGRDVSASPCLP